jgi:uncharacterized protein YecE (DUF72 family)
MQVASHMSLRIGTSGWHYPGGRGTWNGIFYPPPGRRPRGFDELAFYAERFNTVEINATFYGLPRADVARTWVARTPPGFEFAVKVHQSLTHSADDADRAACAAAVDEFKRGIEPLAAAGRLGPLLAQFPAGFRDSPPSRVRLEWLLEALRDYDLAVELRHRSWSDHRAEIFDLLHVYNAAWTQIDEPKFRFSIRQDFLPNTTAFYYLRLHGRNAAQWWDHEQAEDRYNYLYSEAELEPFAAAVRTARALVKKQYVYLNNHFAAQAVADAAVLRHLLDDQVAAPMPPELMRRYPMLDGKVPSPPRSLFG